MSDYVKVFSKATGFKLHCYRHKNENGDYFRGRFDCAYKDPNASKENNIHVLSSLHFAKTKVHNNSDLLNPTWNTTIVLNHPLRFLH
jgi:hypothetical protein